MEYTEGIRADDNLLGALLLFVWLRILTVLWFAKELVDSLQTYTFLLLPVLISSFAFLSTGKVRSKNKLNHSVRGGIGLPIPISVVRKWRKNYQ
jgi:hypothetical protein